MQDALRIRLLSIVVGSLMAAAAWAGDPRLAPSFYEDGLDRFRRGDLDGAVIQLKNALQNDGRMSAAHLLLGRALVQSGKLPAAEAALLEARKQGVAASEVAVPLGRLYLLAGRPRDLLDKVPPDGLNGGLKAEVLTMRASALAQLGDYGAAARGFDEARALAPLSASPWVAEVPALLSQGRIRDAVRVADKAVELEPGSADAWNMRASAAHAAGKVESALQGYGKALELQASHVDARVARAALLVDLQRDDAALTDLEALQRHAANEPRAGYLRAVIATRRGDPAAARAALVEVVRLTDSVPAEWASGREQLLMLGALGHYELGNLTKAKQYLGVLVARYGRNPGARKLLGQVLLQERDGARALSAVEPVLRANPNDAGALYIAGESNLLLRRYVTASEQLERAVQLGGGKTPALTALGRSQLSAGDEGRALATLEASLEKRPGDIPLGFAVASLRLKLGRPADALALMAALHGSNPWNPVVANWLGAMRVETGDMAQARAAYEIALKEDPAFLPARLNLARLDLREGRVEAARAALTKMLAEHRNDPAVMFELGTAEAVAGHRSQAEEWLKKAADKEKGSAKAAFALIDLWMNDGRGPEALDLAKSVHVRQPGDKSLETLGRVQLALGDGKGAKGSFMQLARRAGDDRPLLLRAASLLLATGAPDEADYALQKVLGPQPDDLDGQALLVRVRVAQERLDEAEAVAARMRLAHPARPEGWLAAAEVVSRRGQSAKAEALVRHALEIEPRFATLRLLADTQLAQGRHAEALREAERWIASRPNDVGGLLLGAELAMQSGNPARARALYERGLELRPRDAMAHNNYAMALLALGDAGAETAARRALELDPNSPEAMDSLGWVLAKAGRFDEGLRHLREARLRIPLDGEVRAHLIVVLRATGRTAEADAEMADAKSRGVPVEPYVARAGLS